MRRSSFIAGFVFAVGPALSAQNGGWAVTLSALAGAPNQFYTSPSVSSVGGWGAGVMLSPGSPTATVAFHVDVGYSTLRFPETAYLFGDFPGFIGTGAVPMDSYLDIGGLSANVAWNILGERARVTPFVAAGLGWYLASTRYQVAGDPTTQHRLTQGVVGLDGGVGLRVDRMFFQVSATQLHGFSQPVTGQVSNAISFPLTIGIWF